MGGAELVRMRAAVRDALVEEALRALPAECCGVLGGREGALERHVPVANASAEPLARYEMRPAELWAARRTLAGEGYDVAGYYHSHPRTSAVPSAYDVSRAYYPDAVYVIVGVAPRPSVRAFRIAGGAFGELILTING